MADLCDLDRQYLVTKVVENKHGNLLYHMEKGQVSKEQAATLKPLCTQQRKRGQAGKGQAAKKATTEPTRQRQACDWQTQETDLAKMLQQSNAAYE